MNEITRGIVVVTPQFIERHYTVIARTPTGGRHPVNFMAKTKTTDVTYASWAVDMWDGVIWVRLIAPHLFEAEIESAIQQIASCIRLCSKCGSRTANYALHWRQEQVDTFMCELCESRFERIKGESIVDVIPLADYALPPF